MKVFRNGVFYDYNISYADSSWSYDQLLQVSSLYATCKNIGYDDEMAYSISHMYISMIIMPGLIYPEEYMKKIRTILSIMGK